MLCDRLGSTPQHPVIFLAPGYLLDSLIIIEIKIMHSPTPPSAPDQPQPPPRHTTLQLVSTWIHNLKHRRIQGNATTPNPRHQPLTPELPVHHTQTSLHQEIVFLSVFLGSIMLSLIILFGLFRSIMSGIFLGCLAAYLIDPLVETLSHKLKLHRLSVVLISILMFGLILTISVVVVAPTMLQQVRDIIDFFPVAYTNVTSAFTTWLPTINEHLSRLSIPALNSFDFFKDVISIERLTTFFQNTLSKLFSTVPGLISFGISLTMMPFVMYLYLQHFATTRAFIAGLVPQPHQHAVQCISRRLAQVLKAVIMGQIYVAIALGIGYAVGFSIIGIQGAITIGIAAGIGRLIPYADMIIAVALSTAVILSTDVAPLTPLVGSLIVVISLGMIDAFIITPKLMGSSIGVHPIIILGSVIAFSTIMGFWGMIIAIPVVALFKEFVLIVIEYYRKWQSFYVQNSTS